MADLKEHLCVKFIFILTKNCFGNAWNAHNNFWWHCHGGTQTFEWFSCFKPGEAWGVNIVCWGCLSSCTDENIEKVYKSDRRPMNYHF